MCIKCGSQYQVGSNFCPNCGTAVVEHKTEASGNESSGYAPRYNVRNLKLLFASVISTLIIVGLAVGVSSNSSESTDATSAAALGMSVPTTVDTPAEDLSWVPTDYMLSDDHRVAYKWRTVDYCDPFFCWKWSFVSQEGCPNGFYAAINFLDSSGAVIDYTNASLPSLKPMQTAVLTFTDTGEGTKNAEIAEISCR